MPTPGPGAPPRLFHLALGVWLVVVLTGWLLAGPLGHDEAAYAIGGRALLHGEPSPWLYRSVGMHVLAVPGLLLGGSELALRVPAVLLAVLFLFAVRRVGRLFGESVGAWAPAVVVGMHGLSLRGHELLSDLPSAACLLLGLATLVEELEREAGPRRRVVFAAPWLAAAFYLRYASCVPIAVLGVALVLVYARRIARRPGPIVATAALTALLLLPHALQALAATGSPLGIVRYSSGVPRRLYLAEGLVTYLFGNPLVHYGVVAAPVLLAGLLAVLRPPPGPGRRATRVLWLVATGQIVVLGLASHGQTRYIYVALTLLVVLGVEVIGRLAASAGSSARRAAFLAVALAGLGVAVATVVLGARGDTWLAPIAEAGALVRADAAGRPCHVVSRRFTQLHWYSGCQSSNQGPHPGELDHFPLVYAVWFENTPGTPEPEAFRLSSGAVLDAAPLADRPGRFRALRMTRPRAP